MTKLKVYLKRGATNYKEKRLISEIEKAISKKFDEDPASASGFSPAKNIEELKELYNRYCVEEVEFVEQNETEKVAPQKEEVIESEEIENNQEEEHIKFRKGMEESIKSKEVNSDNIIDPFNDAEPIVRSYVQSGDSNQSQEDTTNQAPKKVFFDEPTSEQDAFELPSSDDENGTSKKSASQKKPEPQKPLNPKFDEMDNGKKKRSTKRFAKVIVEGVCLLAEKGCIWWTTKDITEDKLVQYEIEDSMDLQLLLSLEQNQQVTVRDWFLLKVQDAQTMFKVSDTDKQDLIDSLYEVMLEKGIAPTPMQELIINSVKTFVFDMGLKAFALSSQINSVLTQLKQMKVDEKKTQEIFETNYQQDISSYGNEKQEESGFSVQESSEKEEEQIVTTE